MGEKSSAETAVDSPPALNAQQKLQLTDAVTAYDFPSVGYDFTLGQEIHFQDMRELERHIRDALLSGNPERIKDGLSNVLYWGYTRMGIRDTRVRRFRAGVTEDQLQEAAQLFQMLGPEDDGLLRIKNLKLPQFSQISFVSKIRMFLDPENFAVLDNKLMKLRQSPVPTLFNTGAPVFLPASTSLRITYRSEAFYRQWCSLCRGLATNYFGPEQMRAVDIERAIFSMVDRGESDLAAEILRDA